MESIDYIRKHAEELKQLVHASNLVTKWNKSNLQKVQKEALPSICKEYKQYLSSNLKLKGYTNEIICNRVKLLNTYYNFLHSHDYDNLFSAQGKFRSTILEEFIFLLFKDYVSDKKLELDKSNIIHSGQVKAYSNLFFKAAGFKEFISKLQIGVNTKDQDYAIYRQCTVSINNHKSTQICIPALAVEAKTYIDKTMLDSIIATAEKLKTGNPYVRFIAIAEHYDVGADVDPAYSRIDQIYILRKSRRRDGWKDINANVVLKIFDETISHIERPWSNIEKKLEENGVIL